MKIVLKSENELFSAMFNCFNEFQQNFELFQIDIPKEDIYDVYNKHARKTPIFRKNPEWMCSVCRHTIYKLSKIVTIDDNYKRISCLEYFLDKYFLENFKFLEDMFTEIITITANCPIEGFFYNIEKNIGVKQSIEPSTGLVFKHFHVTVDDKYTEQIRISDKVNGLKAVLRKYSDYVNYLEDILSWIEQKYIYRGMEKKEIVEETKLLLELYNQKKRPKHFIWKHINSIACYFNNDVISTLVDDLKNDVDPEIAIKNYNRKVAPENYRQPKVELLTKAQVEQLERDLEKLGYSNILEGFKFAEPQDLSVLNVLWTNRAVKGGTLTDVLQDNIKTSNVSKQHIETIDMTGFLERLKKAKSIEVDVSGLAKMVLIKDLFEKPIYFWNNHIGFCYETGLVDVDQVTQLVKQKGGVIDAKIRFSLYWENLDDLDLHLKSENVHVCWDNKDPSSTSFQLDIDMNVNRPIRGAVENIFTSKISKSDIDQEFTVFVHNFTKRESPQKCILNVYIDNKIFKTYEFKNPPAHESIELLKFKISKTEEFIVIWSNQEAERKVKLPTKFVGIDTVLLSPNYWEENKGNRHVFFLKKGMTINLDRIRPYNIEQLNPALVKHKRSLAVLSKKIKIMGEPRLVGYGISFSKQRELLVKVNKRPYKLIIDPNWTDSVDETKLQYAFVNS